MYALRCTYTSSLFFLEANRRQLFSVFNRILEHVGFVFAIASSTLELEILRRVAGVSPGMYDHPQNLTSAFWSSWVWLTFAGFSHLKLNLSKTSGEMIQR
jgi:hypothetical protein